ncbi:GDP-mannose 4,6-dehydratase [Patescibacteria group bacterium]|nr:GDP-mannose 4,6-dehydratase [Patescibacteria group bacterium]
MKKALITGVLGQDGPYLAKYLLKKGYKVYGMVPRRLNLNFYNTDYLGITNKIEFVLGDMTDEASLINIIRNTWPDEIYNLAAQSFVGASWDQPKLTTETNALGPLYLLNVIRNFTPNTKFYQASTSEMFGNNGRELQDENAPFAPQSPYGISKLYAYWIANNYVESYGLFCCNGILFNHESPLRGQDFVTRKISEGVAKIKLGLADKITLGNLEAERDWGFAGDYVEAMFKMMQQKKPGNYVVATGKKYSVKDFLETAFNCAGIKNWKKHIIINPTYKRPAEIHGLRGNASRARKELKWKPKVKFRELVAMMVDADLKRLNEKKK